eukprot:scaffold13831_cov75-Phaeocystis_antarctica.AAC.2
MTGRAARGTCDSLVGCARLNLRISSSLQWVPGARQLCGAHCAEMPERVEFGPRPSRCVDVDGLFTIKP